MSIARCQTCVMPATRPDTPFVEGECQACINYRNRPKVDWTARKAELLQLLDRHHGQCIVPSSGGKDSHYQVLKLIELGADVTVVTARTCHLTEIGRKNIDNLARYARTIEVVPNMTVRAKLNRLGLEMVGDISWPEHVAIFTTPFRVAADLGTSLLFYGENPQDQYGGPLGSQEAKQMTARWVSEFGGFLGLRAQDMIGQHGITERDMRDYRLPDWMTHPNKTGTHPFAEAHFLGAYLPWDSHQNAAVAEAFGMVQKLPTTVNLWKHENLDNAQTGLHDFLMYRKYGYGRGCAQASVDVRTGRMTRKAALAFVETFDGKFPAVYAGVPIGDVLDRIGVSIDHLWEIVNEFTDWKLFTRTSEAGAAELK